MLGNRLREARQSRHLSLSDIASRAKISVATLSRIERDKQGIDLDMFMTLARVLKVSAQDLLGTEDATDRGDALAARIASLSTPDRVAFWRDLSGERSKRRSTRKESVHKIADQVDELLAQIEFLQGEIQAVQKRLRSR